MGAWKTLARSELARDGITFNSVLPGRIATDRLADDSGSLEGAARAAETDVPAGRLGTVEEMAAAAAFLCSARASYITGEALRVDGGLTRAV
jgi:3-oxoacyl-[acyl-carrier protein] reductase